MPPSIIQEIQQPFFEPKQFHQERLNLQVLRLVLPIPNKETVHGDPEKETERSGNGWSSLFSLSTPKDGFTDLIGKPTYISKETQPPLTSIFKKTKSGTKNNLDLCTETLGCENGTVYTTDDYKRDGFLCERVVFVARAELEERRRENKEMVERRIKRVKTGTEFPPALKTRTGETCVNIVRKKENGRIVMYVVNQESMVKAERKDGRLRLTMSSSSKEKMNEAHEEKKGRNEEEEEEGNYLGVVGKAMNGKEEMERMRILMAGRCKEEGRRENWESFWVATS
ncbi:hypothetical protein LUZ60_003694 [Juncus effusus]|nr:hypothetical protein LUZ60_003694 [Juncus effusus]